ncbi:hypothetical protein RB595_010515 [Gaeumannomyces hyphopodioides]
MRRSSLDLSGPSRACEEPLGSPSPASPIDRPEMVLSLAEAVEADEELDTVSDGPGAPRIYTPPPHIAARFYRPSQARRKDSAASSRRNSISSAHSLSSAGCARQAGPQSKHIAQHLRRASILEDRKARLADRAAHAEKVRLRAALAKATIRDTSVSEERALAAQQARERNLAEIAAACAEEVKRAKAVAESTKEKREQEIRKLKMQMEERMAEASRRRDELMSRNATKTRSRGHSQSLGNIRKAADMLSDVKEESKEADRPMTPESAARQLQWWWRATIRRRAVAEFQALGLNIDGVRETAFEKVVQLLAQESVLTATSRMLRICGLREGAVGSVSEMAAVRTFLSALLILGHPAQVLSNKDNKGEQEQVGAALAHPLSKDDLANPQLQELVGKARDLLICFENIPPRLTSMNGYTPPPSLKAQLPETYAAFHNTFIAWKARDSGALIDVMLMQFVELDAIWQTVKDSTDPSVTESYRQSIQDNQVMLLVRIKKLAGAEQGKKMVFEAVRKARKSRAEIKPSGDTKPREAADYTVETAMGDLGTPESSEQRDEDSTIQEPSPPEQAKHMTVRVRIPRNRLLPDNRILVHELSIDKNYRLSAEEYREQQAMFLAPLLQRMRDTMQHESQEEEHFRLLLEVAKELRAKLQRLVQQGKSMHTFIGEVLDTEVAYQQFVTGSFSYEKFFATMGQLLPRLCAPVRDDEVRELVENGLQNGTYVDRLEALMSFIDVMSSDHANYLLSLVAPQILSSASQYEAKCFAQALERKEHGLETAEASWRSARGRLLAEAARRDPEGVSHPRSRPTPDRIYTQVLVDLFTRLGPISLGDMPETLRLDHRRAVRSGALTRRIVTTGAILLQCKNMLKRDVRVPWRTEAGRIMTVLEAADERRLLKQKEGDGSSPAPGSESSSQAVVDGVMAALESGRSMPSATKASLRALVDKMEAAAAESGRTGSEPSEPVLRLLLGRLRTHVLSRLAAGSASEKVRTASTAGERLAGLGLAEFVDRVRDMVDEISRVGAVDREAHGPWWEAVAETIDKEGGEDMSSAPSAVASSSGN